MFVTRCVLPVALAASLGACDRSDDPAREPPRTAPDTMEAFAAPDEDTTTGGDEEFVDDYLAPPYDTYDSSDNEDLAWYEGEGETWDEEYDWSGEEWCEEPDDLVCDYVE